MSHEAQRRNICSVHSTNQNTSHDCEVVWEFTGKMGQSFEFKGTGRFHGNTTGHSGCSDSTDRSLLIYLWRACDWSLNPCQSKKWHLRPDRIYILRWSSFSNIYMNVCSKAVLDCWLNSGLSYFTIENYFLRLLGHDTVSERKEKNTHLNETIDAKFNILMRSPCWVNRERLTAIINWFYRFFFCRNVSAL